MAYDFVKINFEALLPDVFERAVNEHIAGPDNSRGWGELVKKSPQLISIIAGIARKHRIPFADAAGLVLCGVNLGYIVCKLDGERRVTIVDFDGRIQ